MPLSCHCLLQMFRSLLLCLCPSSLFTKFGQGRKNKTKLCVWSGHANSFLSTFFCQTIFIFIAEIRCLSWTVRENRESNCFSSLSLWVKFSDLQIFVNCQMYELLSHKIYLKPCIGLSPSQTYTRWF